MPQLYDCKQCLDTGFISDGFGNVKPCPLCNTDKESQSSKHCDSGYMNDVRFGDD